MQLIETFLSKDENVIELFCLLLGTNGMWLDNFIREYIPKVLIPKIALRLVFLTIKSKSIALQCVDFKLFETYTSEYGYRYNRSIKYHNYYIVINKDEIMFYDKNFNLHREGKPAYIKIDTIFNNHERHWYKHGTLHRIGNPAIERKNGNHEHWVNGMRVDEIMYFLNRKVHK